VLKVLVVGPDSLSGELAATVLGRPDIERVHVANASDVLAAAESVHPHMVVLDLPGAEACALAEQLRENEGTRPTAIVALSRARPEAEAELKNSGINVVIPLPIDPFLWDRRLEELLSVPARRLHKIPVKLRDWSRFVASADEDEGLVLNIGARGVLLETTRDLELGSKVGLSFNLPGN
jgi:CheY-like chemotaxis protein